MITWMFLNRMGELCALILEKIHGQEIEHLWNILNVDCYLMLRNLG